jgi:pyruvate dehydrogenase E1 component
MISRFAASDESKPPCDSDPSKTHEWLQALEAVARTGGPERALYLLRELTEQGQKLGTLAHVPPFSAYRNTIPVQRQAPYPGDLALKEKITAMVRWNALAMVVRANAAFADLGGHIASYASAAEIFEAGFNHFFRGPCADGTSGDLWFFQPHSPSDGRPQPISSASGRLLVRASGRCAQRVRLDIQPGALSFLPV